MNMEVDIDHEEGSRKFSRTVECSNLLDPVRHPEHCPKTALSYL
jgi:hypothetical protein